MSYTELIDQWRREYGSSLPVHVVVLSPGMVDPLVVGQTFIIAGGTEARIELQPYLEEGSLTATAILWHEWCHAYAYEVTGRRQGHNSNWKHLRGLKPFLALWDMLPGRFVCAWWRAKLRGIASYLPKPFT